MKVWLSRGRRGLTTVGGWCLWLVVCGLPFVMIWRGMAEGMASLRPGSLSVESSGGSAWLQSLPWSSILLVMVVLMIGLCLLREVMSCCSVLLSNRQHRSTILLWLVLGLVAAALVCSTLPQALGQ